MELYCRFSSSTHVVSIRWFYRRSNNCRRHMHIVASIATKLSASNSPLSFVLAVVLYFLVDGQTDRSLYHACMLVCMHACKQAVQEGGMASGTGIVELKTLAGRRINRYL
ncbi:hypothetical protein ABW21_db0207200 [Orbilia brochopaga]|nr:hypothetical protein ABW21_db0207200 [Drechslerella brochopaga]